MGRHRGPEWCCRGECFFFRTALEQIACLGIGSFRQIERSKGMAGKYQRHIVVGIAEIGYNHNSIVAAMTQECEMTVWIEARILEIHIHKVEERALAQSRLAVGKRQHPAVYVAQLLLLRSQGTYRS